MLLQASGPALPAPTTTTQELSLAQFVELQGMASNIISNFRIFCLQSYSFTVPSKTTNNYKFI